MKLNCLKPLLFAVSLTVFISALLQIPTIGDVHAAPGGQGIGMGPTCPPACPPSPTNCDANLVITQTQNLSFGSLTAPTAGTVTVDTAGTATPGGGVILISGSGASAAQFSMTTAPYNCAGSALPTVTVTEPATLSGPGTMTITGFATVPAAGDAFDDTVPLLIGGTLNVGGLQAAGSYSGNIFVTITFQ